MNIKLDVGYPGDFEILKAISEYPSVKTVYTGGTSDIIRGGRPQYISSLNNMEEQACFAHDHGIEINLALNSPCNIPDKNDKTWWTKIKSYFKDIESVGVDGVIISHPFLMDVVKSYTDLKLVASTICDVRNARSAYYFEQLGADVIVPSMNINWDMQALLSIKKTLTTARLRIMVNEYCLPDCPWRRSHYNHLAHDGSCTDYLTQCSSVYGKNPFLFLANSVIRPENLPLYEEIADDFKIVSRICGEEYIRLMIEAYTAMGYEGNYLDLFGKGFNARFNVDNKALEPLAELKMNCDKNCPQCSRCDELFEKLTKKALSQK